MELIRFEEISKIYQVGDVIVKALDNVSFTINEGEFVVIVGASGAGKSTLLNILGGMDSPTSGSFYVANKNISSFNEKELAQYRRKDIGFVFQFYNLIGSLTALENVMLAASISNNPRESIKVIKDVGLDNRSENFPSNLSGGEQQRVAIARAIVKNPLLLLCDEPTGALDTKTGSSIISLLKEISVKEKRTIIIVTHNNLFESLADHILKLQDGKIIADYYNENPCNVEDIKW